MGACHTKNITDIGIVMAVPAIDHEFAKGEKEEDDTEFKFKSFEDVQTAFPDTDFTHMNPWSWKGLIKLAGLLTDEDIVCFPAITAFNLGEDLSEFHVKMLPRNGYGTVYVGKHIPVMHISPGKAECITCTPAMAIRLILRIKCLAIQIREL